MASELTGAKDPFAATMTTGMKTNAAPGRFTEYLVNGPGGSSTFRDTNLPVKKGGNNSF